VFGLLMVLVLQRFADGLWPRCSADARWLKPEARDRVPWPGRRWAARAARGRPGAAGRAQVTKPLRRPGGQQRVT
jgi:branched-chain amino acid transport system permease protein